MGFQASLFVNALLKRIKSGEIDRICHLAYFVLRPDAQISQSL
jgi:hypothetical protein